MKLLLLCFAAMIFVKNSATATIVDDPVKTDPVKSQTILGNLKDKAQNGRSLVAVNEQSQERSSSRFFGPQGFGPYSGFGGPAQFPGGFGGYPGGFGGYGGQPGYFGGYPGGYPGSYSGGYPGGYGYPGAGAFAGQAGFGYGLQQQQLQGAGYASSAFAG